VFTSADEFTRALLGTSPSTALLTWESPVALKSAVALVAQSLQKRRRNTVVTGIDCARLDSPQLFGRLLKLFSGKEISRTCIVVYGIEPFTSAAARVLNGLRERFASPRALIVAVREDRMRDFMLECPDLMDWIGLTVCRAEDLQNYFSNGDIRKALKRLSQKHKITSAQFLKLWREGKAGTVSDAWLWHELLQLKQSSVGGK
jgi:hypothetical protein